MSILNFFVLTSAERDAAMLLDGDPVEIDPRAVDNTSPGAGINLNDNAASYDAGDPVTLTGCFVAPKRIVDDPDYLTHAPALVAYLLDRPFCTLETETIFAPT